MAATAPVPLWLDHASIAVPAVGPAARHFERRLGLTMTVSPEAPDRHGRILLDRSYLEVAAAPARVSWEATMCFLRFSDLGSLRRHLDSSGIEHRFGSWEGVDGVWDEVEVRSGGVQLPTLIRRTAPPDVARDWPPPLPATHRCGARSLVAVHLVVPSLDTAADAFARLVGPEATSVGADGEIRVRLAAGELVLVPGTTPRLAGIVLRVGPRADKGRVPPLLDPDAGIAWIAPDVAFGLRIGFVG